MLHILLHIRYTSSSRTICNTHWNDLDVFMAIFSASAVKKFFQCSGKKFSVQWKKGSIYCLETQFFNNIGLSRNKAALIENKRSLLSDKRTSSGKMFVRLWLHIYIECNHERTESANKISQERTLISKWNRNWSEPVPMFKWEMHNYAKNRMVLKILRDSYKNIFP